MATGRFLAAALALASGPAVAAQTTTPPAPPAPSVVSDSALTAPQQLVAIDGARRLNLYCIGAGEPAVMLEAGAANTIETWRFVQAEIAKTTRACAYDRAGLGFSDAATRPADVRNMADDLGRLVAAAGIARPYVLVGHSLGGEIAVYAAATSPKDIAGLVLVDPAFADDLDALEAALPPDKRHAIADAMAHGLARKRVCLGAARSGKLANPSAADKDCVSTASDPNKLDATLASAARKRLADPKTWEAVVSELEAVTPEGDHIDTNSAEIDATAFDFGGKPLVVLSRGVGMGAPGAPATATAAVEAAWLAGHAALATRSTKGEHVIAPGARHYIQIDRPRAVVEAVDEVVKAVRGP
ncbi:pimeloyl-ACP methyl ester carboxylesterase [Roseiarcus fermentans]|uniref:Pimeloyl-ACP methyl ester carboxylesterase n=1 Tax=Roseiarcus fermentans TaxID=1473586 RepID=A0A366EVW3_9HYPH|nr:alpha/beta hydrolase [Roseiarcus fermentans]RBP06508.1 pimeloyl-ACP methyl ester carboxylesterase [Roseiarcus fermentans]